MILDKTAVEHWAPEIGGQFWWNGVFFTLFFVPFMIIVGKKLSKENRDYMLYGMGIYQLGKVAIVQMSHVLSDNYILATNLPLQLCSISGILAGVVVFYRKQILLEFLYFFGIVGFIHSILTPEFTGGTAPWNIFDYYVGHSMLFIVPIFLMMFYGFRLRENAWWTSFIYLQFIVVIVSQANVIIGNGANYMYLAQAPIADNPLVLQDPYHILGFELAALAHFYLLDVIARKVFK
ncbi:MAG: TIGR02206 family membrane protein [Candidatus Neomarinimicrobiota bacterium]|nr:TIGR02206 family membrane protein [Candidatus Neomarinimicrobiota bacterium]